LIEFRKFKPIPENVLGTKKWSLIFPFAILLRDLFPLLNFEG